LRRPSAAAAALSGCVWEEWLRSWWILRWGFRRIPAVRALGRGEWSSEVLACRVAGLGAGAANWVKVWAVKAAIVLLT